MARSGKRYCRWNNPTYWSIQGQVWTEAKSDKDSDVGRWFSWGPEDCGGIPACAYSAGAGTNIVVPHVGCAQGSWQSDGENPTTGKQVGIPSALASFGSKAYADYLVDAMANTWCEERLFEPFVCKNDRFAKTGSGRTSEN